MSVDNALIVVVVSRAVQIILVAMECWACDRCAQLFKNDSATQTQREFRKLFIFGRNGKVLICQTILNWVSQFRSTMSALPKKSPGHSVSVQSAECRVHDALLDNL
jgi:hypothetical protein